MLNISGRPAEIKEGTILTRGETINTAPEVVERELNKEAVTVDEINTELPIETAEEIVSILNDFKDLIARNIRQIGCTNKMEMSITLADSNPVVYRPYRFSQPEQRRLDNIVEEMKQADIIEDSDSPFSSPVLLVKKKTNKIRMCVDFRALNRKTVKQQYPIPRIDDQLDRLRGMRR